MPSRTYRGSFGGESGSNGLPATLTADYAVPSGAIITNVSYSLKITAGGYSSSKEWILEELAVGGSGGTPSAYDSATMYNDEHTFSGNMGYLASDVSKFYSNTIQAYAAAFTTHNSQSYLWDVEITVDYAFPDNCVEPSVVTINGSGSAVTTADATALLAWSGAQAGAYNSISGYLISYRDSADGSTWGDIQIAGEVATTATRGSLTVALPSVGTRRKFYVTTCSALGSVYNSMGSAESPVVTRKNQPSKCKEPSGLALSSVASTGNNVTLSWKDGGGGNDNAFSYYQIARKYSADGKAWGALEIIGTTTGLSVSVAAPVAFGSQYMFYVRAVGTLGEGYASAWAVCANTLQKLRPALTGYTDANIIARETAVKAVHMLELQSNINALRVALGLSAYSFTSIRAGYTSLAGWNTHIREMRTAIDGMTTKHEAWITLGSNQPRADVLMQLRRVVAAL